MAELSQANWGGVCNVTQRPFRNTETAAHRCHGKVSRKCDQTVHTCTQHMYTCTQHKCAHGTPRHMEQPHAHEHAHAMHTHAHIALWVHCLNSESMFNFTHNKKSAGYLHLSAGKLKAGTRLLARTQEAPRAWPRPGKHKLEDHRVTSGSWRSICPSTHGTHLEYLLGRLDGKNMNLPRGH